VTDARLACVGFAFVLAFASLGTVARYASKPVAVVYLVLAVVLAVPAEALLRRLVAWLTPTTAIAVAAAGWLALIVAFAIAYPHLNSHVFGSGSDRDDAANIGARRLAHGIYPYGPQTYLHGPIAQLPGGLALAVPFVWIGSSAYANLFWLPVLFLVAWSLARDVRPAAVLFATVLVASPAVIRELLTGGDLIANTAAVTAGLYLVLRYASRTWPGVLAALGLGVALAWRANFALVLVPLAALLLRRVGFARAGLLVGVAALAGALCSLPVVVRAAGREALRTGNHLSPLNAVVSHGATVTVVLAALLALVLARSARTTASVFAQAAAVQAFVVVVLVAGESIHERSFFLVDLASGYGVPALLLALVAAAAAWRPAYR
jgi:hypothetical protein